MITKSSLEALMKSLLKGDAMPESSKEANGGLQDEIGEELPDDLNVKKGDRPDPSARPQNAKPVQARKAMTDEDDDPDYEMPEDDDAVLSKSIRRIAKSENKEVFAVDGWLKAVFGNLVKSNDGLAAAQIASSHALDARLRRLEKAVATLGLAVAQEMQKSESSAQQPAYAPRQHSAQTQAGNPYLPPSSSGDAHSIRKGLSDLAIAGKIPTYEVAAFEVDLAENGMAFAQQQLSPLSKSFLKLS